MRASRLSSVVCNVAAVAVAVVVVAGVVVSTAGCPDEQLSALRPRIELRDPDDALFSVCAVDFVDECAFHFGDVAVGQPRTLTIALTNPARADLSVRSLEIEGAVEQFSLEGELPTLIAGGAAANVSIRYLPTASAAHGARVTIKSDAENLPPGGVIVIDIDGNGTEPGAPSLSVEPAACDFGAVGVGVRALCTLSLRNDGVTPLTVEALDVTDNASGVFAAENDLALPATVQPGTAVSASFSATPQSLAEESATLLVVSNDPLQPSVAVPFVVRGTSGPTAVARIRSINGVANAAASPAVEPLDDVVLSGAESVAAGSASIVSYAWTIVEKPAESSVVLSAPNAVETGFTFSSADGDVSGVDVAGTFRISLVVTDSDGAVSENDATVTLNAVPTDGLHVQLTWSVDSNDLDLHLGRGFNVSWCTNNDCYYGNCEFSGPNWDGVQGFTDGDPVLDIDDLRGFGPENINIESPVDNSYIIAVHAYDGNGGGPGFTAADATIKIFIGGALVDTFVTTLTAKNQFWRVARVEFSAAGTSITPVDTVQPNTPNGC